MLAFGLFLVMALSFSALMGGMMGPGFAGSDQTGQGPFGPGMMRGQGVFTAVVTNGKRELLQRLLDAGVRVPPVLTGCQSYVLEHTDMLRTLLLHGMSPDLMNWQHQTLLHLVCNGPESTGQNIERAAVLLDAGATISARDDEYGSTPLAWAARTNAVQMVEFLLGRGAPANLADDEPWATPLAWAERRHHAEIVSILRRRGVNR